MDAPDPPASAEDLIVNPARNAGHVDQPKMTAGMTFLGRLLDHGMAVDPTSSSCTWRF